ncbi:hypothetical protein [Glaciecola sp. 1036]|uniref:hypothetical protein n=1 Tax=Alteromonadaceae TaxID=72275 RepID=UPI003D026A73
MLTRITSIIGALALILSQSAQASYIVDNDFYTTVNHLDWLDVTLSLGVDNSWVDQTLAQEANKLDGDTALTGIFFSHRNVGKGWRRATGSDFAQLMLAFDFISVDDECLLMPAPNCSNNDLGNDNGNVNQALRLLGDTGRATFNPIGDTALISGRASGILADVFTLDDDGEPIRNWVASIVDNDLFRFAFGSGSSGYTHYRDTVYTHAETRLYTDPTHPFGHWLIRDTTDPNAPPAVTFQVDEPNTIWIILLACAFLYPLKHRFGNRPTFLSYDGSSAKIK